MSTNMRKRSKLTLLLTCVVLFLDRAEGLTSDIDAIGGPLHEKIKLLEARHETLEAATEQFRVRANSLNKDLEEERSRCDRLERSIVEDEHRYADEVSSWRMHVEATQAKFSSMESEYQIILWGEKAKVSYLEQEISLKDVEIFQLQERLVHLQSSLTKSSASGEPSQEIMALAVSQEENQEQTQQHIAETSFQPKSIPETHNWEQLLGWKQNIMESDVVTRIVVAATECFEWLKGDVLPQVQELYARTAKMVYDESSRSSQNMKLLLSWIRDQAKPCYYGIKETIPVVRDLAMSWYRGLMETIPLIRDQAESCYRVFKETIPVIRDQAESGCRVFKETLPVFSDEVKSCFRGLKETIHLICTPGIRLVLIPIIQLLSKIGDCISTTFSTAWGLLWHHLSAHLRDTQIAAFIQALRRLQTIHQLVVVVFELLAIAASTYFVTGLSGTQDHWFYKTCISAKLNSGPIIVTIEVLAGLLAMELSLAALHRKRRRRGRDAAKSKGHKLAVSMKGMKPSASLLRSSGGLSLSESSSRSYYSLSLD